MRYQLYYWPSIQGRGEFVRLALEEAGADYVDVARKPETKGGGVPALLRLLDGRTVERPPFAPPFLKAGRLLIGQTANILMYLGDRHGLAPKDEAGRLWAQQLQLTVADLVGEVHDTHHPISGGLYYREQRREARRTERHAHRPGTPRTTVRVVDDDGHVRARPRPEMLAQLLAGPIGVSGQTQEIFLLPFAMRRDVRAIHARVRAHEPQPVLDDQRVERSAQHFLRFG